jgi:LacI family transcriptional regulator
VNGRKPVAKRTRRSSSRARPHAPARPAARPATVARPAAGGRATINDVARLSGVSKKTVSRVINQSPLVRADTRARVQGVIQRFGYVPDPQARGLAFRKSFLIGLVYDNPNAQYVVNVMEGALDALKDSDFELVVHPCDRKSAGFIAGVRRFVTRQRLRGVILLPPVSDSDELTRALNELDCAYVRISYAQFDVPARMVASNDREAVAEAANYLESLGHRRVGFITGPPGFRSAAERSSGFLEALERRGVTLPPELIVEGGYTYESGIACGEALLSRTPRPTAIFASNDEMAAGVYRAAQRLGLAIPHDLSVIGFDDGPLAARLLPSLTTIRLPIRDIGRLAAGKLIDPANSNDPERVATSPIIPHLVIRDSCQSPPR